MSIQPPLFGEEPAKEPTPEGQRLVTYYVDEFTDATGYAPPRRMIGQMADQIGTLLHDGIPAEVVKQALSLCVVQGKGPNDLPYLILKAHTQTPLADRYVKENGWPTGWRMVRGTHGSSVVRDPLGHDRGSEPPAKITKYELEKALRERQKQK